MGKKTGYRTKKKSNKYIIKNNFILGFTEKGEEFYFDLEDFDKIKNFYWHVENEYVIRRIRVKKTKRKRINMHHLVFKESVLMLDHINGNKSDNRKSNLRPCNKSQNAMNSRLPKNNTSGYKGVNKHQGKFTARIKANGINYYLGIFDDIKEAVNARKQAEQKYFGEFAPK